MKKMITIFMIAGLAAGCATQNNPECGYPQNECSEPVVYEVRQEAIQVQTSTILAVVHTVRIRAVKFCVRVLKKWWLKNRAATARRTIKP